MKSLNRIIGITAAFVTVAAVVTLIIAYRNQIKNFLDKLMEKASKKAPVVQDPECADFEDFADI